VNCTPHKVLLEDELGGAWEKLEMSTKNWIEETTWNFQAGTEKWH